MIKVNIRDAKTHPSRYLRYVTAGETAIPCRRNVALAERPMAAARTDPRPIGLAEGSFEVSASFFEPLPDEHPDALARSTGHHRVPTRERRRDS